MQSFPIAKDLVLVGGGHSHVIVLRMLAMRPVPGLQVTLVNPEPRSAYSGMLPGVVAGHYTEDDIHIELAPLCRFAGARLIVGRVTGIDPVNQALAIAGRPSMSYDALSLDVGITPNLAGIDGGDQGIAVKPINDFLGKWDSFLERAKAGRVSNVAFVGAGAGGVELCLAVRERLRNSAVRFHLVSDKAVILPQYPGSTRARFMRQLKSRAVEVHTDFEVSALRNGVLTSATGQGLQADEVFFVTRAGAAGWLRNTGLPLNDDGFIRVRPTLQVDGYDNVFACGDIAHVDAYPRPKAGVYAVRQGPPLYRNLLHVLFGRPARPFRPQRRFLSLITTGPRHAVAEKYGISAEGAWVWQWKNWIDRRFMHRFNTLPEMPQPGFSGLLKDFDAQMHCGGCGAKVSADILKEVLDELGIAANGLDDAAITRLPEGELLLSSADAFRAFIDDPYVFARVAVNHALSDIYAMGGKPLSVLAIITLPYATPGKARQLLTQLLSGARAQLNGEGVLLAGGHTTEGAELSLGFAVNGVVRPGRVLQKSGMRPGDKLVLTRSLGTGALFAADMQAKARGRWLGRAIEQMLASNRTAAGIFTEQDAHALTDITGFGLAGHLAEMLLASNCSARLELDSLPVLPGTLEVMGQGITSSLHEGNRRSVDGVVLVSHRNFEVLFDPQTAGGLLASVDAEAAEGIVADLRAAGYPDATVIGEVLARDEWLIDCR